MRKALARLLAAVERGREQAQRDKFHGECCCEFTANPVFKSRLAPAESWADATIVVVCIEAGDSESTVEGSCE